MRNRILFAFILMTSIFIGCKNEKSADQLEVLTPEVVDNTFKVTVDVIVKKDDDFCFFYTDGSGPDFKEPIWMGVKGNETSQKVVYLIPNENFPSEIRLDFGMKKDQEDVVLKSVLLEYKGKKREIIGAELGTYFRADDTKCTFDPTTGIIKAVVKSGVRQSPSLYPQDNILKAEIEKFAK
jgi:hypothetical protein